VTPFFLVWFQELINVTLIHLTAIVKPEGFRNRMSVAKETVMRQRFVSPNGEIAKANPILGLVWPTSFKLLWRLA
jgi:hypothetical protein